MNPTDDNQAAEAGENALNMAIREAIEKGAADDTRIDPGVMLAYLSGSATKDQIMQVQAMLARSPGFRKELIDIAGDFDQLESVETAAAFDAHSPGEIPAYASFVGKPASYADPQSQASAPRTPSPVEEGQPSVWGQLCAFFQFRKPAYAIAAAYAVTFVLMAYPTYRYLTTSPGETGTIGSILRTGIVVPSNTLSLRPEMNLRGEEATVPPREVLLSEAGGILDLTFWTITPRTPQERYHVVISNADGVLWQDRDYHGFANVDNHSFRLLVNAGELGTGEVNIVITRLDQNSGNETLSETYRILLK